VEVGIHVVPLMPAGDVVDLCVEAERIGYDYALVADEGFHPDVYACLGAIARETSLIRIGPVTNGYTRHPAVTATAVATLNELSEGRALVTVLAGGSMVLGPMGVSRDKPYRVVKDTVEVMKRLWSGRSVSWEGYGHELVEAELGLGSQEIPIWMTSRGPLLLGLTGREADVAMITVKADLGAALDIVDSAAASAGRRQPRHAYLGRVCYTPEMISEQRSTIAYVLMDSPPRVLASLGFDEAAISLVAQAAASGEPELLDPLVDDDLLKRYQINGTPEECAVALSELTTRHSVGYRRERAVAARDLRHRQESKKADVGNECSCKPAHSPEHPPDGVTDVHSETTQKHFWRRRPVGDHCPRPRPHRRRV